MTDAAGSVSLTLVKVGFGSRATVPAVEHYGR
jgi:hypothetical protein